MSRERLLKPPRRLFSARRRSPLPVLLALLALVLASCVTGPEDWSPAGRPVAPHVVTTADGRSVVLPPACSDWSQPSAANPANHPTGALGCANAHNLGLMIAEPADLVRGRAATAADGEAATLAIQRYRRGEIRAPVLQETQ